MKELEKGVVSFGCVSSWSTEKWLAYAFAETVNKNDPIPDDEIPVVFNIPPEHNLTGVPIVEFSKFREKEVLTAPETTWSVVAIWDEEMKVGGKKVMGKRVSLIERR